MQSPPNLIIHNQPWETFFGGKLIGKVGVGFDAAEFAVFDQCGDDGPVVAAAIGTREQSILTIESKRPDW